jgi:hypothetical protein
MPSWHEQLRNLNGTREDDEQYCHQIMPSPKSQSECKPSRRVNYGMFEDVGRAGFRPQAGRNQ